MSHLKNIIFDLGGVLIDIDYNRTSDAFKLLGVKNFEEMYAQFTADELFEKLETGNTSEDQFYKAMSSKGQDFLKPIQIQSAWNAMLMDFRLESFSFLETLKDKYTLFLLSNTNIIHKTAFDRVFREQTGKSIDDYFTKAYYSHLMGLRKPNRNIFEFVLDDAGLIAGETLFIDDSRNNIDGAADAGIQTRLLLPGERIEDIGLSI